MSKGYKVVRSKRASVNTPADTNTTPKTGLRSLNAVGIPKSTEEVLQPKLETVDSAPQHGEECCAAPTVDAGCESGTGHWEGDGSSIKFVKGESKLNEDLTPRGWNSTGAPAPNKKKK